MHQDLQTLLVGFDTLSPKLNKLFRHAGHFLRHFWKTEVVSARYIRRLRKRLYVLICHLWRAGTFAAVMACTLQTRHCRGSSSYFFARRPFMNTCPTPYRNSSSSHIRTASRGTYGARLRYKPQKVSTDSPHVRQPTLHANCMPSQQSWPSWHMQPAGVQGFMFSLKAYQAPDCWFL